MTDHMLKVLKILLFIAISFIISDAASLNNFTLTLNQSIKENNLDSAFIGIKIINMQTGKSVYKLNSEKNFIPASNTKLVTAAAALLFFDKDFQYKTAIYYDQIKDHSINNLYIDFSGDPSLTTQNLRELLEKLQTNKITEINNIYFINRFFQGRNIGINNSQSDSIFAYGAPSSIYNLNENASTFELKPYKDGFVIKHTKGEAIKVYNQLVLAGDTQLNTCQFNASNINNFLKLSGCLPENNYTFNFAIQNPKKMMEKVILRELKKLKIKTNIKIEISDHLPQGTQLLSQHVSEKLPKLLHHMLEFSDNLYAQSILRTIGYYYLGTGSIVSGKNSALEILKNKLGLDVSSIQLEDGVGTSENNLLSPDFLVNLLYKMSLQSDFKLFKSFFPIYGETGTLANRNSSILKGKVIAKTGTETTSIALSGYLYSSSHDQYIFSILINSLKENQKKGAKALEKDLLESILLI